MHFLMNYSSDESVKAIKYVDCYKNSYIIYGQLIYQNCDTKKGLIHGLIYHPFNVFAFPSWSLW